METQLTSSEKPDVHLGRNSFKNDGHWVRSDRRKKIMAAIEKKILEGKKATKVIYNELLAEGLIADQVNDVDSPALCMNTIWGYIRKSMVKLEVANAKRDLIIAAYDRLESKKGYGRKIAKQVGCGKTWVYYVISRERKKL